MENNEENKEEVLKNIDQKPQSNEKKVVEKPVKAKIFTDDKNEEVSIGNTESQIRKELKKKNKKKRLKKIIIWLIIIALLVSGSQLYNFYNLNRRLPWQPDNSAELNKVTYTEVKVEEQITSPVVDITGSLQAYDIQSVVLRTDGAITSINYQEGDKVMKGEILVTVDDTNEQYSIADIESQIKSAKLSGNANTLRLLELQLVNAKNNLDYTKATANFDGVVALQGWEIGDYNSLSSSSSSNNMIIADLSKFKTTVEIDQIDINYINVGQKAELSFDSLPGAIVEARVSKIPMLGRYSKQGFGVLDVELTIDNPDERLKTGFTYSGKITSETEESIIIVDQAAVETKGENSLVKQKMEDGSLKEVIITIRYLGEGKCQILSGDIKVGDTVVIENALSFDQMLKQEMKIGK